MHRALLTGTALAVALAIGGFAGYWLRGQQSVEVPQGVFALARLPTEGKDNAVHLAGDLKHPTVPTISQATARMKFLPDTSDPTAVQLAYVVTVQFERLDPRQVPEERKAAQQAGDFIIPPLAEQVILRKTYFEFALFDKDGFKLAELEGPDHALPIRWGARSEFQGTVHDSLPLDIARRTAHITARVSIK